MRILKLTGESAIKTIKNDIKTENAQQSRASPHLGISQGHHILNDVLNTCNDDSEASK